MDVNNFRNNMYEGSGICTGPECWESDGQTVVTLRDVVWHKQFVFQGGDPPRCDSVGPEVSTVPSPDAFVVFDTLFPADDSVRRIVIHLVHQVPVAGVSLAFNVHVDGAPASFGADHSWIQTLEAGFLLESSPGFTPPYTTGPALIGGASGPLYLLPGRRPISNTLLVFMPPVPIDRVISVELVDMTLHPLWGEPGVNRNSFWIDTAMTMWDLTVGPSECPFHLTGDGDLSGSLTSTDVILIVNYVFKSGTPPFPCPPVGDVNCDQAVSSSDIITLVNHIFKGAAPPCDACTVWSDPWGCF
jgi:hypothetical protein